MKKSSFTLEQLKFADELCFPADAERLFKKYSGDEWPIYSYDFKHKFNSSLMAMIFAYSRADYEKGMGEMFENIINDLLTVKN